MWCFAADSAIHLSLLRLLSLDRRRPYHSSLFSQSSSLALLVLAGQYPDPSAYIRPFVFFALLVICRRGCLLPCRMLISGWLLISAPLLHSLKSAVCFLLGFVCFTRWFFYVISGSCVWSSFNSFHSLAPVYSVKITVLFSESLFSTRFIPSEFWKLWWGSFFVLVLHFWLIFFSQNECGTLRR